MNEQLISLKTAKLAKKKGFDIKTEWAFINYYSEDYIGIREYICKKYHTNVYNGSNPVYLRPTQSLLQRWLREEHKINIIVFPMLNDGIDCYYNYDIYSLNTSSVHGKHLLIYSSVLDLSP